MDFNTFEASSENGQPLTLYSFALPSRRWDFASSEKAFTTIDGRVWQPAPISNDGIKQSGEAVADTLNIELPTNIAPVQLFMTSPPTSTLEITIYNVHRGYANPVVSYVGELSQINFPMPGKAVMTCETLSATMRREGLRLTWQRACPYVLYDLTTCKINKEDYAVALVISAVDGRTITVTGMSIPADDLYSGGMIEWNHPVKGVESLGIESNDGLTFTIFGSTQDLYVGLPITGYRGCLLTPAACQSFGNYDNYGGIPKLPGKSPFSGDPLF